MRTAEDIIKDSITDGLGLPRTGIQNDVIEEGISKYNFCGRTIWDAWPWDTKKIDQFSTSDSSYVTDFDTTTGVITFAPNVDLIRAVQAATTGSSVGGTFIWNESEINMAMRGQDVTSGSFMHMADTAAGLRRIQVASGDDVSTYRILATKTFTKAIIDPAYNASTPSSTPTDEKVQPLFESCGLGFGILVLHFLSVLPNDFTCVNIKDVGFLHTGTVTRTFQLLGVDNCFVKIVVEGA